MPADSRSDAPRRVLVTGASRGIGAGIARALAADGFELALNYRSSKAAAEALLADVTAAGAQARLLPFDVADRDACEQILTADVAEHGAYWGMVSNAGVTADAPFPTLSGDAWDRVLRTNLDGFYNVVRPTLMQTVRARRGGRIVAISSVAGLAGNRGQVNYAASKAGLVGATKSLAQELAKRQITVNCVAPGLIDTEMIEGAPVEEMAKLIPMRRLGTPADVAGVVSFLFSEAAGYVTGQVLSVNGGML